MDKRKTAAIILAAGKSTRMNSVFSKVLHKIYGKPMLCYVLDTVKLMNVKKTVIVTNGKGVIKESCVDYKNTLFAVQNKLLGTGHAVAQAKKSISKFDGDLLVLYGDMPLITIHTLERLIAKHKGSLAACTLLTAVLKEPLGYGRIIRDASDRIIKIIEEQDASVYEKAIEEVNVGVYCFRARELFGVIDHLSSKNKKREYYLTDVIELLGRKGFGIESVQTDDISETTGVNSRQDLAKAQEIAKNRILDRMMSKGVGIIDPDTTHIYNDVEIGRDTVIYPFTVIESDVKIGRKCRIGPFSRIRNFTEVGDEVEIGNFTEIVRSKIGAGSKIKHRTFLADTDIGKHVNIGAGATTANYDGKNINKTRIGDRTFIGSGTIIIAPAVIGKEVVTGAGSVITKGKKVPPGSTIFGVPAKVQKNNRASQKRRL